MPDGWQEAFARCKETAIASGAWESYKAVGEAFNALETMLAATPPPAEPPIQDIWEVAKAPYPNRVIDNPDAEEWANYFVHTFPRLVDKRNLMKDWFQAAMMAMYFSLRKADIPEHLKPAEPSADVARDAERLRQFEKWANAGYAPCLAYDDDGHWQISFDGFNAVGEPLGRVTIFTEKDDWHDSVGEAIDAARERQGGE